MGFQLIQGDPNPQKVKKAEIMIVIRALIEKNRRMELVKDIKLIIIETFFKQNKNLNQIRKDINLKSQLIIDGRHTNVDMVFCVLRFFF